MTVKTYTLEGFIKTLELVIGAARDGKLVAVSINLGPNGLGHYSFKMLDGNALPGLSELDVADEQPATAPGKGPRRP